MELNLKPVLEPIVEPTALLVTTIAKVFAPLFPYRWRDLSDGERRRLKRFFQEIETDAERITKKAEFARLARLAAEERIVNVSMWLLLWTVRLFSFVGAVLFSFYLVAHAVLISGRLH